MRLQKNFFNLFFPGIKFGSINKTKNSINAKGVNYILQKDELKKSEKNLKIPFNVLYAKKEKHISC